jgi:hypothetical protein
MILSIAASMGLGKRSDLMHGGIAERRATLQARLGCFS